MEYDMITCPGCGVVDLADSTQLGVLGKLIHYRCRSCGVDYNIEQPINEEGG